MSEAQGNTPITVEDDPIQVRKNKRAAFIAAGKNPYGHAFDKTRSAFRYCNAHRTVEQGNSSASRKVSWAFK